MFRFRAFVWSLEEAKIISTKRDETCGPVRIRSFSSAAPFMKFVVQWYFSCKPDMDTKSPQERLDFLESAKRLDLERCKVFCTQYQASCSLLRKAGLRPVEKRRHGYNYATEGPWVFDEEMMHQYGRPQKDEGNDAGEDVHGIGYAATLLLQMKDTEAPEEQVPQMFPSAFQASAHARQEEEPLEEQQPNDPRPGRKKLKANVQTWSSL